MIITFKPSEIERLYKKVEYLPAYAGPENRDRFVRNMYGSLAVIEFSFGFIRLTSYRKDYSITAHGVFWSHKMLAGVKELIEGIAFVKEAFHVPAVEILVPAYNRGLTRLIARLPFRKVRTLHNGLYSDTIHIDADLYRA